MKGCEGILIVPGWESLDRDERRCRYQYGRNAQRDTGSFLNGTSPE